MESFTEVLFDPLFRVPLITGLMLAVVLPLLGSLLMLREEWLAALGLAHLAAASALLGLAASVPAVIGGTAGALAGGAAKTLLHARGNAAYGFMILIGWAAMLLVAANTAIGDSLGHALIDGQLYFAATVDLSAALILAILSAAVLPWLSGRLLRAFLSPLRARQPVTGLAVAFGHGPARRSRHGRRHRHARADGSLRAGLRARVASVPFRAGLALDIDHIGHAWDRRIPDCVPTGPLFGPTLWACICCRASCSCRPGDAPSAAVRGQAEPHWFCSASEFHLQDGLRRVKRIGKPVPLFAGLPVGADLGPLMTDAVSHAKQILVHVLGGIRSHIWSAPRCKRKIADQQKETLRPYIRHR